MSCPSAEGFQKSSWKKGSEKKIYQTPLLSSGCIPHRLETYNLWIFWTYWKFWDLWTFWSHAKLHFNRGLFSYILFGAVFYCDFRRSAQKSGGKFAVKQFVILAPNIVSSAKSAQKRNFQSQRKNTKNLWFAYMHYARYLEVVHKQVRRKSKGC